jgi:hypothetical protein
MTQPPPGGQSAPPPGGYGSVSAPRHPVGAERNPPAWGATTAVSASNAPSTQSDSPTGSVPSFPGTTPATDSGRADGRSAGTTRGARSARARGPRRARLQLRHINPWTVLKFSCVLAIALFFVWLIVVGVLYGILDGAGVIGKINSTVLQINPGSKPPVRAGIVFGGAAVIGVVNIVLFIALSTVGSVVYNLCADLVGGIEITLSER